jgi:hypothetical protein
VVDGPCDFFDEHSFAGLEEEVVVSFWPVITRESLS